MSQTQSKISVMSKTQITDSALKLITLPEPTFKPSKPQEMDAAQIADMGFEQVYKNEPKKFIMRDGASLFARTFAKESNITIILLHGVLSNSYLYNKTAGLLRDAADAEVIALDFRGHGQSAGTPGDVSYIDQYADDVADVIAAIRKTKPNNKIIIAGHSMGGGVALRYAMKKDRPAVDGYCLFAPLLGHTAPTLPYLNEGWLADQKNKPQDTKEPFMKIHVPRIIGLTMLNSIGIHTYDSLHTIFFNLPDEMPLKKYSSRSNISMAPDDYAKGLQAVNKPLLVLVGSDDEAFVASAFKPAVTSNSKGVVIVIEGASHNGIRHNDKAMKAVKEWMPTL